MTLYFPLFRAQSIFSVEQGLKVPGKFSSCFYFSLQLSKAEAVNYLPYRRHSLEQYKYSFSLEKYLKEDY